MIWEQTPWKLAAVHPGDWLLKLVVLGLIVIITGGHTNKAARTISFYEGDRIRARPLTAMLKQIIDNDGAGGWRKLTHHQEDS
jgi:hypothetical protein